MTFPFADISSSDISIMIGAIVTIVGSFLAVAKIMINQSQKESNANREERFRFSQAVEKMANGMEKVAETNKAIALATKRGADEAKERNGHLADISNQNKNQIIETIHGLVINKQTVHNQFVENEQVNHKD